MPYRLEISKNNRAGCKAAGCKEAAIKILKDELRHGVWVPFQEHGSWHWRHWGCVTPKVIGNMRDESDMNPDMLDGYDELTPELQDKVMRALEQGHVDDEDWKGEDGYNVPGSSGKGPTAAQKKKIEAQKAKDAEDGEGGETKPAPKKRARAKKEEPASDAEEAPAPKKARGKAKKAADEEVEEKPKRASSRAKKPKVPEPSSETEEEAPPAKKKAAPKKAAPKKAAAAPKKATKAKKAAPKPESDDEVDYDSAQADEPVDEQSELSEPPEEPVVKPKKGGRKKKA